MGTCGPSPGMVKPTSDGVGGPRRAGVVEFHRSFRKPFHSAATGAPVTAPTNCLAMNRVAPPRNFQTDLLAKFGHVSTWVFDLDNTLYPPDCGLWPQINQRVTLYLAALTGLDGLSARALQRYYYHRCGTTLSGLVEESAIDPEPFLSFVHDVDRSGLARNDRLARELERLPGRRLIFTNGSRDHALRTVAGLGLDGLFEDAFDIVASGLTPKPAARAYQAFFDRYGVDPTRAAMFEDLAKNLLTPKLRGMTTTLVAPRRGQADERDAVDREDRDIDGIDFVTDDLAGFLARVNDQLEARRVTDLAAE